MYYGGDKATCVYDHDIGILVYEGNNTLSTAYTGMITTLAHSQCLTHHSLYTPSSRMRSFLSHQPRTAQRPVRIFIALLHNRTMTSQTTRAPVLKTLNAAVRGLLTLAAASCGPHMKGGFTKVHFYSVDNRGPSPSPSLSRVDMSVGMITRRPLAFLVSGTQLTSRELLSSQGSAVVY